MSRSIGLKNVAAMSVVRTLWSRVGCVGRAAFLLWLLTAANSFAQEYPLKPWDPPYSEWTQDEREAYRGETAKCERIDIRIAAAVLAPVLPADSDPRHTCHWLALVKAQERVRARIELDAKRQQDLKGGEEIVAKDREKSKSERERRCAVAGALERSSLGCLTDEDLELMREVENNPQSLEDTGSSLPSFEKMRQTLQERMQQTEDARSSFETAQETATDLSQTANDQERRFHENQQEFLTTLAEKQEGQLERDGQILEARAYVFI